jgi:hypothetical protein
LKDATLRQIAQSRQGKPSAAPKKLPPAQFADSDESWEEF